MAAARARRIDPAPAPKPAVKAVPRRGTAATAGRVGSSIRWDRVGRVVLLVVLLGITSLYIGPLHSYWSTRQQAAAKHNEVQQLLRENVRLKERRAALRTKGTLEKEARKLGMVRPGERPYSVSGLPKGP
jgi:cell division protein FtsB